MTREKNVNFVTGDNIATGTVRHLNGNGQTESPNNQKSVRVREPDQNESSAPGDMPPELSSDTALDANARQITHESETTATPITDDANPENMIAGDTADVLNEIAVDSGPDESILTAGNATTPPAVNGKSEKYAIKLTTPKFVELLQQKSDVKFFHDQHGNPFVWVRVFDGNPHYECLPLGSRAFRAKLVQLADSYATNATPAGVISETIKMGELLAFKGTPRELANRHRSSGDVFAIDLGDMNWQIVRISANGWEVCQQSEPMFFRPQHLKPLPEPVRGGDPFELFEYVTAETEEDKLLILSWMVSALNPDVPSPILAFTGHQGSAKTTTTKRLRDLVDPSVTPVLGDVELSNLFLTFQHHAVPAFENVSKFDRRTADMFCRAVTGNGVERRKLFTNSDQVLYSFRRPIIINGIDTPSTRPDFLDRCIVINCQRITTFRTLKELDAAFQEAIPRLFGALLDLFSKTLSLLPDTPSTGNLRMADFTHFGRALARALGKTPEDFDNAYRLNIRHLDKEVIDATPLTLAVKQFAIKYPASRPWKGSAQELLGELRTVADRMKDPNVRSDIPKSARWLSSRLGELVTALASEGVIVRRLPRTSSVRGWEISFSDDADIQRRSAMTPDERIKDDLERRDLFQEMAEDDDLTSSDD